MPSTLGVVASAYRPTPPPIPMTGLAAWYDANDTSTFTLTGSLVEQWRDKSGNGITLTAVSSAQRPSRTGALNGKPTLVYAATASMNMKAATLTSIGTANQALTIIRVFKWVGAPSPTGYNALPGVLTQTNYASPLDVFNTTRLTSAGNAEGFANPNTCTTWSVHITQMTQATGVVVTEFRDGGLERTAETSAGAIAGTQYITIGSRGDNYSQFIGEVAEVIVYDRVLTAPERQQVETYLQTKWWSLPSPGLPVTDRLVGWWDASDVASITASGGAVSQWNDKSGWGRHFSQSVVARQPATGIATLNSKNVISFPEGRPDANNAPYLYAPLASAAVTNVSMFVVFTGSSSPNPYGWIGAMFSNGDPPNTGYGIVTRDPTTGSFSYRVSPDAGKVSSIQPPILTSHMSSLINTAGAWSCRYDTTEIQTGAEVPSIAPTGGTHLGHLAGSWSGWAGQMAEVIIYNKALSTTERQQVESYLKTKWGTP